MNDELILGMNTMHPVLLCICFFFLGWRDLLYPIIIIATLLNYDGVDNDIKKKNKKNTTGVWVHSTDILLLTSGGIYWKKDELWWITFNIVIHKKRKYLEMFSCLMTDDNNEPMSRDDLLTFWKLMHAGSHVAQSI